MPPQSDDSSEDVTGRTKSEQLAAIIRAIAVASGWDPAAACPPLRRAVDRIEAGNGPVELFFAHRRTNARLEIVAPAPEADGACDLLIRQPLDPELAGAGGSFLGSLGRAHEAIGRRHATEALDPVADEAVVLRGTLSTSLGAAELVATFSTIERIVAEVDALHDRIRRPVRRTIDGEA